jgi:hypothetical protein
VLRANSADRFLQKNLTLTPIVVHWFFSNAPPSTGGVFTCRRCAFIANGIGEPEMNLHLLLFAFSNFVQGKA